MSRARDEGLEERILDSAFRVFGEEGFQATTLKRIASGAGISSGSIYNYFPDKESLFRATVERGWDRFIEEIEAINLGIPRRSDRILSLLDRGFVTLGEALPLIRGMLFDASRLNLLEPKLERICASIDRLIAPEEGEEGEAGRGAGEPERLQLIRILILGLLSSAALVQGEDPPSSLQGLRGAILAFLRGTGLSPGIDEPASAVLPAGVGA